MSSPDPGSSSRSDSRRDLPLTSGIPRKHSRRFRLLFVHAAYGTRGGEDQAVDDLEREMLFRGHVVKRFGSLNADEGPLTFARAPNNWQAAHHLTATAEDFKPDV